MTHIKNLEKRIVAHEKGLAQTIAKSTSQANMFFTFERNEAEFKVWKIDNTQGNIQQIQKIDINNFEQPQPGNPSQIIQVEAGFGQIIFLTSQNHIYQMMESNGS